jgi:GNAT superfamily N-acetyltransferase
MSNGINVLLLESLEHYELIQQVFRASCEWFGVEQETAGVAPSIFSSWVERINEKEGFIIYGVSSPETTSPDEIVGFLMSDIRDAGSRHVWLAATHPTHQRKGIMRLLFNALEDKYIHELRSLNRSTGRLTVNTYPLKFSRMPSFLASQGFEQYSTVDDSTGTKHSFQKFISIPSNN